MRLKIALVIVTSLKIFFFPSTSLGQESGNCDNSLIPLYESNKSEQQYVHAWLQMINQQNYSLAKTSASGSALLASGGMFEGGYDSFSEKRSKYLKKNEGHIESRDARETFKTYLMPEQLKAWTQCKVGLGEPAALYKNVDKMAATVIFSWDAPASIGGLNQVSFEITGAKISEHMLETKTLNGTKSFILVRTGTDPIRGTMKAVVGVNHQDVAADFYIPAYQEPSKAEHTNSPVHLIIPIRNVVRKSVAYFDDGHKNVPFTCLEPEKGFDMVVIREEKRNLGQTRGSCVTGRQYCNGNHEWCVDTIIRQGCFVNTEWHDWYKQQSALLGLPISNEAACKQAD